MADVQLSELTHGGQVRSLSGQERGVAARAHFKLDDIDARDEAVVVHAHELAAITPSFLQGMFSKSMRRAGSREAFLARYQFDAASAILNQLDKAIANTFIDRSNLFPT